MSLPDILTLFLRKVETNSSLSTVSPLPVSLFFFRYSDGDLTLIYPDGTRCSTGFQRMTIINFECNKTACETDVSFLPVLVWTFPSRTVAPSGGSIKYYTVACLCWTWHKCLMIHLISSKIKLIEPNKHLLVKIIRKKLCVFFLCNFSSNVLITSIIYRLFQFTNLLDR